MKNGSSVHGDLLSDEKTPFFKESKTIEEVWYIKLCLIFHSSFSS